MFNPQTGSPSTVFSQQQVPFNPFSQGGAFGTSPFQQPFGVQPQPTAFFVPQQTGFPVQSAYNPFGQHLQPQPTATPIMPQMTAINPFRQNTPDGVNGVQSQATGFNPSPFGPSPFTQGTSPFQVFGQAPVQQQQTPFSPASPFNPNQQPNTNSPFAIPQQMQQQQSQPPPQPQSPVNNAPIPLRPASAPLKTSSPEPIKPLVSQQTGSRNPFGIPTSAPPPVPKVPTLMELAMNKQHELQQMQQQQHQNGQPGQTPFATPNPGAGSVMSSIASDFTTLNIGNNKPTTSPISPQMTSTTNSSFSTDTLFSSVSTQPTGVTSTVPPVSVQHTGGATGLGSFTGLKPFKPSSSFGASLLESLPPIPGSGPTTPAVTNENKGQLGSPLSLTTSSQNPTTTTPATLGGFGGPGTPGNNTGQGNQSQPNGFSSTLGGSGLNTQSNGLGALNSQQPLITGLGGGVGTGLTTNGFGAGFGANLGTITGAGAGGLGVGPRPQVADVSGAANPFKPTIFSSSASTPGFGGIGGGFNGSFGGLGGTPFGQNPNAQPQQQQQSSLI